MNFQKDGIAIITQEGHLTVGDWVNHDPRLMKPAQHRLKL